MTAVSDSAELRFGPFRLQGRNGPLFRGSSEIKLQPKTIAVLWALIRQNGQVLSRSALLDAVWPGADVGDEALTFQVQTLRKALEEDPKSPRYVVTVHRVGFRFAAPVQQGLPQPAAAPSLFVGRAAELDRLAAAYAAAASGQRRLVLVTGDAGLGKSGLIESFLSRLAAEASLPRVSQGHCIDSQQQGEPYLPLLQALSQLVRESADESTLDLLRRVAPNWLVHLPALLEPGEQQALRQQTAGGSQEGMLREMAETLELLADKQPLVLVIEDLHWSDSSTLKLLRLIASRGQPAKLLILCSSRPGQDDDAAHPLRRLQMELSARGGVEELPLGYLGLAEVRQYLSRRDAALAGDAAQVQRIYERSAGHPLFLAQLTDYLLQSGAPLPDEDEAEGALPPRLRDLIELQLSQLPLADQLLLEVASVSALEFTAASVAHCTGLGLVVVEAQLERLLRLGRFVEDRGLSVWPDGSVGGRYAFRHVLYRATLRRRLSASREARLRLQIAERMEQAYGARSAEIAAELAEHFAAGGRPDRALAYCIQTAARALERRASIEVRQQFARGIQLLDSLPAGAQRDRAELSLQIMVVGAWQLESGFASPEALPHLLRMKILVAGEKDPALLEPALASLWLSNHFRCLLDEALVYAGDVRDLGRGLGKPVLECCGLAWNSNTLHLLGRHREAAEQASAAIHLAREAERDGASAHALGWQAACAALASNAIVSWFLGSPDRALRLAQEARRCAERTSNPSAMCTVFAMLTSIWLFRRDWLRLVESADEVIALCEQNGHKDGAEWTQMHRLIALAMLGDPEPPLDALRALTARRHRANAYVGLPSIYVSEAEIQIRLGRHGAAMSSLDKARDLVGQRQMFAWEPELLRVEAELHLAQGNADPEFTEGRLRQALAISQQRGAHSLALRSAISLARLGGAAEREPLQQIYDRIPEGRDTADLREARSVLDRFGTRRREA